MRIKRFLQSLNPFKRKKKEVQKVVIDLTTLNKITHLSRELYEQENYERKRLEEMNRFASILSHKISEGINLVMKHNLEPLNEKLSKIETKLDSAVSSNDEVKKKVEETRDIVDKIDKEIVSIKDKLKYLETSQEKNVAKAIETVKSSSKESSISSDDEVEKIVDQQIKYLEKAGNSVLSEVEKKGIDIDSSSQESIDINLYILGNTFSFIYFIALLKDNLDLNNKIDIRSYFSVSLMKEEGLDSFYKANRSIFEDSVKYFYMKDENRVSFDSRLAESLYYYQLNSIYSMFAYFRYLIESYLLENKENISNDKLRSIFLLAEFIWFLLKKLLLSSEGYKYPSAKVSDKELPSILKNRYKIYSNIPLGIHSFNVVVLTLQMVFLLKKSKYSFSIEDILKLVASALSHDVGKMYESSINKHKNNQQVVDNLLKDFYTHILNSRNNLSFPFSKRIFLFFNEHYNKLLGEILAFNWSDQNDFLKDIKKEDSFSFISHVIMFHHLSLKDLDFHENQELLYKIVYFADKYARILENRYFLYLDSFYKREDLEESTDIKRFISEISVDIPLIFNGYKFDMYSKTLNSVSDIMYSFKNLTDNGKSIFMSDLVHILETIVEVVSSGSYYGKENRLSFVSTRDAYKVPVYYLKNEFLSYGWGSLVSCFQYDVLEEEYFIFDFSEFSLFLKQMLSGEFSPSWMEISREKSGDLYVYFGSKLIRGVLDEFKWKESSSRGDS